MANYIIPAFILFILAFSLIKKINAYDSFVGGAKQAIDLCINTFPYLVAIFAIVELLQASGECDASGNTKLADIGVYLKDRITQYFKERNIHINLKEFIHAAITTATLHPNILIV